MKDSKKQEKNQHEVKCQCNKITLLISCNKEQFPLWLFVTKLFCNDCYDPKIRTDSLLITRLPIKGKLTTIWFDYDRILFVRWKKYVNMDKNITLGMILTKCKENGIVLNLKRNKEVKSK